MGKQQKAQVHKLETIVRVVHFLLFIIASSLFE